MKALTAALHMPKLNIKMPKLFKPKMLNARVIAKRGMNLSHAITLHPTSAAMTAHIKNGFQPGESKGWGSKY